MTEVINKFLIGNGDFFPTLHVKIDKDHTFLYCIVLYILIDNQSIELCHCDNHHEKGHHIHFKKSDGTERQEKFEYKSIAHTIDYLQENWKKILEDYKKNG